jgi:hypothetical protein
MLGGNPAWIKAGSGETDGAFTLLEYVAEPGFRMPFPHTHSREDEAAYVLEGQLVIQIGERMFEANAGAFIIKPRGIRTGSPIERSSPPGSSTSPGRPGSRSTSRKRQRRSSPDARRT